jgi:hypothetical protein
VRIGATTTTSLVAFAVMAHSAGASAVELTWTEPAPCPMDELSFRVERALSRPLVDVPGPTFQVSIERQPDGLAGRVEISASDNTHRSGLREVGAASCEELIDTLALTLVLAIRAGAERGEGSPEAPTQELTPTESAADETMDPASMPVEILESDASGAAPKVSALGAVVGDTGSLPSLGVGVTLGVDLAWTGLELRALGMLLPSREGSVDANDPASPGADISLVTGGALVCVPLATNVGGELGRLSGRGTHVDQPYSSTAWWLAARADLAARWALPMDALALELALTAAAPLSRDEFVLRDIGSVHQPANVVGRASLGLRVDLGP